MGTHTLSPVDQPARIKPSLNREHSRAMPLVANPPHGVELTVSEAELAARLSAALEYAPSRQEQEPRRPSQPAIARLVDAPPLSDIDDVSAHQRRAELPPDGSDSEGPETATHLRAPTWLRRSGRRGWRERLSSLAAWLTTTFVVIGIIAGMIVGVLGPTRSTTLLAIVTDEVRDIAHTLAASEAKPAP